MSISLSKILPLALVSSLLLPTFSVKAALVTYQVDVNIDSGLLLGNNYTGILTYDDASLTGIGNESVLISYFDFLFDGITYTQNDDLFANVDFLDGQLLGLNYAGSSPAFPNFTSAFPPFFDASFSYDFGSSGGSGIGVPTYTLVPENSPVTGILILIGTLILFRKKL